MRHGELEAQPVRVVEVDALQHPLVIDRAEHLDAVLHEPVPPATQLFGVFRLQRHVIENFISRMRGLRARRQVGDLEERDARAVGHAEEDVEVRKIVAGRGDMVVEDGARELHAEDARIEVRGGRDVVRDVGGVVQHARGQA